MRKSLPVTVLLSSAIIGVALNLRPVMAGVGPLLDQIGMAAGLSYLQASLLTSIPVAVIGLCALLGQRLHAWFGERNGTTLGMACITLACLARLLWPSKTGLIATAMLAGLGIALIQVLLPIFIKRRYGAGAGGMLGLYSTGIMGGAAIAAASAAPVASRYSLADALAMWAAPALIALALWLAATRQPAAQTLAPAQPAGPLQFGKRPRAWALLVFFGVGTGAYTLVLAWLPAYYTALGWTAPQAGYLLGALTATEVLAGLLVSVLASRYPDRRAPLLLVLALLIAGLACLIVAPTPLAWLASGLLGLGIGALFPLSLILTVDHLDDPLAAGRLAAFVQGGGYLIASLMPLAAGLLRDSRADLTHAWLAMAAGCAALALLALRFAPSSYASLAAVRRTPAPVHIGYFGKLPSRADFVKGGANPAMMREMDTWLSQAMERLQASPRWQAAYDTAAPVQFALIDGRRDQAVVGHLVASRDQSGRRYPFMLAGTVALAVPEARVPDLPLICARLWRRLATLVASIDSAADPAATLQAAAAQPVAPDRSPATHQAAFDDFLARHTLASLDAMLASSGHTSSTRQLLPALRGRMQQPLAGPLLLPLPEESRQRRLAAAFWLHLVAPLHAGGELTLFITRIRHRPAMVLDFSGMPAQALQAILDPDASWERDAPDTPALAGHISLKTALASFGTARKTAPSEVAAGGA